MPNTNPIAKFSRAFNPKFPLSYTNATLQELEPGRWRVTMIDKKSGLGSEGDAVDLLTRDDALVALKANGFEIDG